MFALIPVLTGCNQTDWERLNLNRVIENNNMSASELLIAGSPMESCLYSQKQGIY